MRAVRAVRAALAARLAGFLAFLPAGAAFFVLCALDEAERAGAVVEPPEDCPATGSTIISKESRPARQREASRGMGVGESATLMCSLRSEEHTSELQSRQYL